jgi:RNA polymerase sigma-70 factor (ECF subfamily)
MAGGQQDGVDDRELLRRHVAGDTDAFGEIFARHRDRMWGVALSVCADPEVAADAVQDGFVNAFRRAGSYRGDAQVTTWLHRIVVNACLDRLRAARPHSSLDDLEEQGSHAMPAAPDRTGAVDDQLLVQEALATLPEAQRLVLVLVDMHGVPVAEVAEMLGVAPGTVKSRGSRGRAAVAAYLRQGTRGPLRSSETEGQAREEEPR